MTIGEQSPKPERAREKSLGKILYDTAVHLELDMYWKLGIHVEDAPEQPDGDYVITARQLNLTTHTASEIKTERASKDGFRYICIWVTQNGSETLLGAAHFDEQGQAYEYPEDEPVPIELDLQTLLALTDYATQISQAPYFLEVEFRTLIDPQTVTEADSSPLAIW